MVKTEFLIDPLRTKKSKLCTVTADGIFFYVAVENCHIGTMFRDENAQYGYSTDDLGLKLLLKEISSKLFETGDFEDLSLKGN